MATFHEGFGGDIDVALAGSSTTVRGTWQTQRVSHAQLETHGSVAWLDAQGRLVVRTSTQVPYLVRDELARILDLPVERVRVFSGRVGGGFGGKQELLTDLAAIATLRTGRPCVFEMTRTDEMTRTTYRHPMRVTVELGADDDGQLAALRVEVLSDTGAYGNHAIGVMFHACAESVSIYNCPVKRIDAEAVYTNNPPSGAFRGYGLGQVIFAVESAMDELALRLGIDPFELRRRNAVADGDPLLIARRTRGRPDVRRFRAGPVSRRRGRAAARQRGRPPPGPRWRVGEGMAIAAIATMAPRGHISEVTVSVDTGGTYHVGVGTCEFGNGTTTVHTQIVATALATDVSRVSLHHGDTDAAAYDTGAFASAGTTVAGKAVHAASLALRDALVDAAGRLTGADPAEIRDGPGRGDRRRGSHRLRRPHRRLGQPPPPRPARRRPRLRRRRGTRRDALDRVQRAGIPRGRGHRYRQGRDPAVGPRRRRGHRDESRAVPGQVEGGVAQGIGSALYEEIMLDEGVPVTRVFRTYRVPQMADIPYTEVYFADTADELGPFGAKSMSESPFNPVAPALANAIRRAIGVRPHGPRCHGIESGGWLRPRPHSPKPRRTRLRATEPTAQPRNSPLATWVTWISLLPA